MNTKDTVIDMLIEEWIPTLTQDQLLERYGTKYMMYLYKTQTQLVDIEKIEKEYDVRNSWEQASICWKIIMDKYGEVWFARYMVAKFPEFRQISIHHFGDMIHQDMMNFLIK